jgi:diguanylate cyclase (GGDEF)-like protein/PAS domain S-box-containing protein
MRSLQDVQTLRLLVRSLREGLYITTVTGRILDANAAFLEIFGATSLAELQDRTVESLLVDPARRAEELRLLGASGAVREFELEILRPDGQTRTVLDTAYQVVDDETGELLCHGILVDITDRKQLERQLREMAIRDPLTGCRNRRFLQEAAAEMERTTASWGVIVADIDHFKDYNDRYGHDLGDRVLIQVGRFLAGAVRVEDPVVRTGGDEFAILLPGLDAQGTREVVERLLHAGPGSAPVSFTLGWASRESAERVEDTLRRADQDLIRVRVEERQVDLRR